MLSIGLALLLTVTADLKATCIFTICSKSRVTSIVTIFIRSLGYTPTCVPLLEPNHMSQVHMSQIYLSQFK